MEVKYGLVKSKAICQQPFHEIANYLITYYNAHLQPCPQTTSITPVILNTVKNLITLNSQTNISLKGNL